MLVSEPLPLSYGTVDDYLGPRHERFFGDGYKRSTQSFKRLAARLGQDGEPYITGTACAEYPVDWSRKGGVGRRPHLSTVDVLSLGVRLAESYLAYHHGLSDGERGATWVRRAEIRAGTRPVEHDLSDFPVSVRPLGSQPSPGVWEATELRCVIGTFTLRLDLLHPRPSARATLDHILCGAEGGPFGSGYKRRRHDIRNVTITPALDRATAQVEITDETGQHRPVTGVESAYQPSPGMIDTFVAGVQVGQIMLYERDGVARADSDTLWMRSTVFTASRPDRVLNRSTPIAVSLTGSLILRTRNGETWRRADINAVMDDLTVSCSVAHRLVSHQEENT